MTKQRRRAQVETRMSTTSVMIGGEKDSRFVAATGQGGGQNQDSVGNGHDDQDDHEEDHQTDHVCFTLYVAERSNKDGVRTATRHRPKCLGVGGWARLRTRRGRSRNRVHGQGEHDGHE